LNVWAGFALAADRTFVWAWERSGWLNAYTGEPDTAIARTPIG
jgi:hypothetical protein